ncbi:MAG: long-chain fatty acid--CoA ligase [Bacteroidales bacterium]|jgi:long-chain acyl-CoA synthetase|nr:long-chain fatty acid--CoA ligase [Bacteroidales bacterium]
MKKTVIQLFNESVEKYPDNVFLWEKKKDKFDLASYIKTKKRVHRLAAGLLTIGLKRETKVSFLAEGRNDWVMGELAVLHTDAVNVLLSIKLDDGKDRIFRIVHLDSEFIQ